MPLADAFSEKFLARLNDEQRANLIERFNSAPENDIIMSMSMHENARHDWLLTDDPDLRTKILQEDGTLYRFGQMNHDDYIREPGWIGAVSPFVEFKKEGMIVAAISFNR